MAFTIAHMAAAIPFYRSKLVRRQWLQFDALIIGTMIPDLPYYLSLAEESSTRLSHQWHGIITYCLPWGLLIWILWYFWLRVPIIALTYPFLKSYMQKDVTVYQANFNHCYIIDDKFNDNNRFKFTFNIIKLFISVCLGTILGTVTHLIWDATTHIDGFVVQHINFLQFLVYIYPIGDITLARILQYLSSLLGLIYLGYFFKKQLYTNPYPYSLALVTSIDKYNSNFYYLFFTKKTSILILVIIGLFTIGIGVYSMANYPIPTHSDPYNWIGDFSVTILRAFVALIVLYASTYNIVRFKYIHNL